MIEDIITIPEEDYIEEEVEDLDKDERPSTPFKSGRHYSKMNKQELKKYLSKLSHQINGIKKDFSTLDKEDWPEDVTLELQTLLKELVEARKSFEERFLCQ